MKNRAEFQETSETVTEKKEAPKKVKSSKYIITVTNLALREGPGKEYEKLGIAPAGLVSIMEIENGFGRLEDGSGWVCMDYTRKAD